MEEVKPAEARQITIWEGRRRLLRTRQVATKALPRAEELKLTFWVLTGLRRIHERRRKRSIRSERQEE